MRLWNRTIPAIKDRRCLTPEKGVGIILISREVREIPRLLPQMTIRRSLHPLFMFFGLYAESHTYID